MNNNKLQFQKGLDKLISLNKKHEDEKLLNHFEKTSQYESPIKKSGFIQEIVEKDSARYNISVKINENIQAMVQEETELFAMAIHLFKKSNFSTLRVSRA